MLNLDYSSLYVHMYLCTFLSVYCLSLSHSWRQVENDDGIWLKLSKDSVKKFCDAEVESWTLAVAVSGRVYLAQDGDTTYQSQVIDTSAPPVPTQPAFPTAASVFGTPPQKSVFGTPLVSTSSSTFQFGTLKLQFGSVNIPPLPPKPQLFKFGSAEKFKKRKVLLPPSRGARLRRKLRSVMDEPSVIPSLIRGGGGERGEEGDDEEKTPPTKREGDEKEEDNALSLKPQGAVEEEKGNKTVDTEEAPVPAVPPRPTTPPKKALSPALAECQRAVYAAFLWQEGLVPDAIVSASYLKFHPELSKEMKREQKVPERDEKVVGKKETVKGEDGESGDKGEKGNKQEEEGGDGESEKVEVGDKEESGKKEEEGESGKNEKRDIGESSDKPEGGAVSKESPKPLVLLPELQSDTPSPSLLPATLNHLVTFWDEISSKVLDNSSAAFPSPKVPPLAQELIKRYEDEKKEIEKRKKEKDKKSNVSPGGGGTTVCELCEQSFPDPITYHMKDVHPGCGKHASGWGYNSRGTFCSGWAGNCGDGGRGGSTWYLVCKDCHAKYLAMKHEVRKKTVRVVPLPKMKTKKPGKPRSLPVVSAVQGMIQNAKFLLEISCPTDNKPATTPTAILSPGLLAFSKQTSFPNRPLDPQDPKKVPPSEAESCDPSQHPTFLRSMSLAATSPLATSSSSDNMLRAVSSGTKEECLITRQRTVDSPLCTSELHSMGPLVFKPSINLARLMYNRSKHGSENKEIGYGKVMAFILQYHDINGLRMAMKQSMRVAGIRAFAMEVYKKKRDYMLIAV